MNAFNELIELTKRYLIQEYPYLEETAPSLSPPEKKSPLPLPLLQEVASLPKSRKIEPPLPSPPLIKKTEEPKPLFALEKIESSLPGPTSSLQNQIKKWLGTDWVETIPTPPSFKAKDVKFAVLILIESLNTKETTFYENMAVAISNILAPACVVDLKYPEKRQESEAMLLNSAIRLLLAPPYLLQKWGEICQPLGIKVHPLQSADYFRKNPQAKKLLWDHLCSQLI